MCFSFHHKQSALAMRLFQSVEYPCGMCRLSRVIRSCVLNFKYIKFFFNLFRLQFDALLSKYRRFITALKRSALRKIAWVFIWLCFTFEKVWALAINADLWREMRSVKCALSKDAPRIIHVRAKAAKKKYYHVNTRWNTSQNTGWNEPAFFSASQQQ